MVQLRYREACGAVWYGIVQSEIELNLIYPMVCSRHNAVRRKHLELPERAGLRSTPCHLGAPNPIAAWPRPTFEELRFAGSEK